MTSPKTKEITVALSEEEAFVLERFARQLEKSEQDAAAEIFAREVYATRNGGKIHRRTRNAARIAVR